MSDRSFIADALVQAAAILAAVSAVVAAALHFTEPLWRPPLPPPPAAVESWVPMQVGSTDLILWRPSNWTVRQGRRGHSEVVVLQAAATALFGLQVWHSCSAPSPGHALRQVFSALRRQLGFWTSPGCTLHIGGAASIGERASWWQRAGLTPVAWHAEAAAAQLGQYTVLCWMLCDRPNWPAFASAARATAASISLLPGSGRSRRQRPAGAAAQHRY